MTELTREFLQGVQTVLVDRSTIDELHAHLARVGRSGYEAVGFWVGTVEGAKANVTTAIMPGQTAGALNRGLAVVISGEELFRMNRWLHQNGLRLIAQVHTHPSEAFHSETDDEYAVLSEVGGFSIVVPDFASAPFSLRTAAVYRLDPQGIWQSVPSEAARKLFRIAEDR